MGKVIGVFQNGYPGTVSRQKDDVIKSFKNSGGAEIPFGVPVYLNQTSGGVEQLSNTTVTTNFVGFTVRIPDKTPNTHPTSQFAANPEATYLPGDPVDVLVRGSMTVAIDGNCRLGTQVYVRRSDNKLVCVQGESNTTVELPGVYISRVKDASGYAEIVISKRNLI
jgi:hypothetical protein